MNIEIKQKLINETGLWRCPEKIAQAILSHDWAKVIDFSKSHLSYDENKFWGRYYNLYESQDLVSDPSQTIQGLASIRKEKLIIINPKTQLIAQVHRRKFETWYALTSNVSYFSGENPETLKHHSMVKNETVSIPPHLVHKLVNTSDTSALVYEIQTGFCHEEDVERFQ